jgi:hypothetical protein
MALTKDITNALRGKSIIHLTGSGTTTVHLANLAVGANETITNASIATVITSSNNGAWTIKRGADAAGAGGYAVFELTGENYLPLTQSDISVSTNSSSNLVFTNSGTQGTLIMTVTKIASYATPLSDV